MAINKTYSAEDTDTLIKMKSEGRSFEDIAAVIGRTPRSVKAKWLSLQHLKKVTQPGEEKIVIEDFSRKSNNLGDYTFREILNYLYKNGFRIEDNKLVRYTRSEFNLDQFLK